MAKLANASLRKESVRWMIEAEGSESEFGMQILEIVHVPVRVLESLFLSVCVRLHLWTIEDSINSINSINSDLRNYLREKKFNFILLILSCV